MIPTPHIYSRLIKKGRYFGRTIQSERTKLHQRRGGNSGPSSTHLYKVNQSRNSFMIRVILIETRTCFRTMIIGDIRLPRTTISNIANVAIRKQPRLITSCFYSTVIGTKVTHLYSRDTIQRKNKHFQHRHFTPIHRSFFSNMASTEEFNITKLNSDDFTEWAALFKGYINFYETSIPEEQYEKTFQRILDPENDLYALGMRQHQVGSPAKMVAIAHFFPQQTPWSEKKVMLLNGTCPICPMSWTS